MNGFVDKILPKSEGLGGWPRFSLFCWLEMNLAWLALREGKKKVLWKTREREEISSGCTNCPPPPPGGRSTLLYRRAGGARLGVGGGGGRGCRPPVLTEGRPVRIGIGPEEKKKEERYRSRWIFRLDNKNQMSKGSRPIGLPSCSEVDECCLARLAQRVVDSQKIQVGHG